MKRYLLFAWQNHSPLGGLNDLIGDYDTIKLALNDISKSDELYLVNTERWDNLPVDEFQILDIHTSEIIKPEI